MNTGEIFSKRLLSKCWRKISVTFYVDATLQFICRRSCYFVGVLKQAANVIALFVARERSRHAGAAYQSVLLCVAFLCLFRLWPVQIIPAVIIKCHEDVSDAVLDRHRDVVVILITSDPEGSVGFPVTGAHLASNALLGYKSRLTKSEGIRAEHAFCAGVRRGGHLTRLGRGWNQSHCSVQRTKHFVDLHELEMGV